MYMSPKMKEKLIKIYLKKRNKNTHSRRLYRVFDKRLKRIGYEEK